MLYMALAGITVLASFYQLKVSVIEFIVSISISYSKKECVNV